LDNSSHSSRTLELDDGRGSEGVKLLEYILDLVREVKDRLLDGAFDFFEFFIGAVVHAVKPDAPRTACQRESDGKQFDWKLFDQ
jgi:hypothetical protein